MQTLKGLIFFKMLPLLVEIKNSERHETQKNLVLRGDYSRHYYLVNEILSSTIRSRKLIIFSIFLKKFHRLKCFQTSKPNFYSKVPKEVITIYVVLFVLVLGCLRQRCKWIQRDILRTHNDERFTCKKKDKTHIFRLSCPFVYKDLPV